MSVETEGHSLYAYALKCLARREYCRAELHQRLERRVGDGAVVQRVLEQLERDGLLSEQRYVEVFIDRSVASGRGPIRIRAELHRRGVEQEVIENGIAQAEYNWLTLAQKVLQKKLESSEGSMPAQRQANFLLRQGFAAETVEELIGHALADTTINIFETRELE